MNDVAKENKMAYQKDVKKVSVGQFDDFLGYLDANMNTTKYTVIWCTDKWDISQSALDRAKDANRKEKRNERVESRKTVMSIPCQFSKEQREKGEELIFYSIFYNKTLLVDNVFAIMSPWTKDPDLIHLQ